MDKFQNLWLDQAAYRDGSCRLLIKEGGSGLPFDTFSVWIPQSTGLPYNHAFIHPRFKKLTKHFIKLGVLKPAPKIRKGVFNNKTCKCYELQDEIYKALAARIRREERLTRTLSTDTERKSRRDAFFEL